MIMVRIFLIFEICLVLIFIGYRLYYSIKSEKVMWGERKKRFIDGKLKLKPDMRDPILKRN
jgi:hypothetical protein